MCQLQGLALNSHNQVSSVAHCLASLSLVLIVSSDMYLFTERLNQGPSAHLAAPCTVNTTVHHQLSVTAPTDRKTPTQTSAFSSQTKLSFTFQYETWIPFQCSSTLTQLYPLLHWKGQRQQPSKWDRQNRPPLFTFSLPVFYGGK